MKIRHATPDDADLVFHFVNELARYEREPEAVVCTAGDLRQQLGSASPPFSCLLAELEGEPVGFALYFFNYSTWRGRPGLYLEDLFVVPEARGRGAGKQLLVELARIAVARGCARMEWTVVDWNEPAIDFYRALGARRLDGWQLFRLTGPALEALAEG
jgi:GNAT superfamily N-acetyltransferase